MIPAFPQHSHDTGPAALAVSNKMGGLPGPEEGDRARSESMQPRDSAEVLQSGSRLCQLKRERDTEREREREREAEGGCRLQVLCFGA